MKISKIACSLAAIAILSPLSAQAACASRWYTGNWYCQMGRSQTALRIFYDGAEECSVSATSELNRAKVALVVSGASPRHIDLKDEAGNAFHLEPIQPGNLKSDARGTATIDGLADPMLCSRRPLRQAPQGGPRGSVSLGSGATVPIGK